MTKVDIYSKKHAKLMTNERREKLVDFIRSSPRENAIKAFFDYDSLPTPKDFVLFLGKKPDETMDKIDRLLELTA